MSATQHLHITLPNEVAEIVKTKVSTGEYASASDVVHDGLRALFAREHSIETWLHDHIGPAWDALKADPTRAVTTGQVRSRLAAEHAGAQ